ncbi:TPA: GrpB family protein [Vibrio cholerae]|nr:GrpB family protein [Vibrio cholerae]
MKVEVVDYNPDWSNQFENEKQALVNALGSAIEGIHHIGSTSVNGLAAKPIIDIIIECSSLSELDAQTSKFESLGYEAMGEFGISGRRYYRKGGDDRTHQIHAFVRGDNHVYRHLVFRDYLAAHPEVLESYAQLKRKVAAQCNHDIEIYCDGKDSFIKEHEAKALEWKLRT